MKSEDNIYKVLEKSKKGESKWMIQPTQLL
jgi:hypothetical protein